MKVLYILKRLCRNKKTKIKKWDITTNIFGTTRGIAQGSPFLPHLTIIFLEKDNEWGFRKLWWGRWYEKLHSQSQIRRSYCYKLHTLTRSLYCSADLQPHNTYHTTQITARRPHATGVWWAGLAEAGIRIRVKREAMCRHRKCSGNFTSSGISLKNHCRYQCLTGCC